MTSLARGGTVGRGFPKALLLGAQANGDPAQTPGACTGHARLGAGPQMVEKPESKLKPKWVTRCFLVFLRDQDRPSRPQPPFHLTRSFYRSTPPPNPRSRKEAQASCRAPQTPRLLTEPELCVWINGFHAYLKSKPETALHSFSFAGPLVSRSMTPRNSTVH